MSDAEPSRREVILSVELIRVPTEEEVEAVCSAAEEAGRQFIVKKLPLKTLEDMEITVEAVGDKPLMLRIEIALDTGEDNPALAEIAENATDTAVAAADVKIRELCLCGPSKDF